MTPASPRARLLALLVFAGAMGWLEGVVVVYLREVLGIAHRGALPDVAGVMERMRAVPWVLPTEQTREAATLVMLAAVAWIAARTSRARLGALLVCFGTWDIVYYVALVALLRWPPSLATMDVLFLLPPHPWWNQPVWVPVVISAVMIAAGAVLFAREAPPAPRPQENPPARR